MQKVGLIGWRGMVGSVLMERMQQENDFALIDAVFFSTSQAGQKAPSFNGKDYGVLQDAYNLDALKADMRVPYANDSDTVAGTIEGVLPSGWTVVDHSYINNRRTIKLDAGTPLDVIQECASTYSVVIRYDVKHKQVGFVYSIWIAHVLELTAAVVLDKF